MILSLGTPPRVNMINQRFDREFTVQYLLKLIGVGIKIAFRSLSLFGVLLETGGIHALANENSARLFAVSWQTRETFSRVELNTRNRCTCLFV